MKIQRAATDVISISLPKRIMEKLEVTRKTRGQSRSGFITSLIEQAVSHERWQRIYKKGSETARHFKITSEDDIDRILHASKA